MDSVAHPQSSDRQLRKRPRQEPNPPDSTPRKRQKSAPKSKSSTEINSQNPQANRRSQTGSERSTSEHENQESVAEEHFCPICHLLLYQPVKTKCQHRLCRACMEHWAEVSAAGMVMMDLDEAIVAGPAPAGSGTSLGGVSVRSVDVLEARCPMCRMQTSADSDVEYGERLAAAYPRTWTARAVDGMGPGDDEGRSRIQNLTVYVGNRHGMVDKRGSLEHEWMFFVRTSRTDIIEEVQIQLYPSTRRSAIILQRAPYNIWRTGDACVMVVAYVILKAGYSWISDDAIDSPDGVEKGMLPLEWVLDFNGTGGTGSMGRCVFKVKNDREWNAGGSEEQKDQREWDRLVRAYQRDGRYEPPEDDD